MNKQNSFLELKVIWKDDDMFEVKVTASNGRYLGTTEVYDTSETLSNFAKSLASFPIGNETLFYESGQPNSYAYFSMKFYCIDNAGNVGIQISLEENVSAIYRPEEKDKIILENLVEPNAIDDFQKALMTLARNQRGIATIYGKN